jgi:hypothetical protein
VTIGVELAKKLGMQNPDHRRNYGLTVVCGGSLACEEIIRTRRRIFTPARTMS